MMQICYEMLVLRIFNPDHQHLEVADCCLETFFYISLELTVQSISPLKRLFSETVFQRSAILSNHSNLVL